MGCLVGPRRAPARWCQLAAGHGLWGYGDTQSTMSPLPQSVQDFHEDLFPDCTGMLPATGAQAWWAGDSQQVSVTPGGVLASGISRAATAPCLPLCSPAGEEGQPAPSTETQRDLHLAHHCLYPAAGSQHQPHS